jgi:antitoxin ParD1/3/4
MNVTLNPELERFVEYKVSSGLYHSASEVVNEGLRLLWERERGRVEDLLIESEKGDESPITKADWKDVRRSIRRGQK